MKILSVSMQEWPGGAETSAYNLFLKYKEMGHESWLLVGNKKTEDRNVFEVPKWTRATFPAQRLYKWSSGTSKFKSKMAKLGILPWLPRYYAAQAGFGDFGAGGCQRVLRLCPSLPDIVHCHNSQVLPTLYLNSVDQQR